MDTIAAGDLVSFISRPTGTRIHGHVVRHFDHRYVVRLSTGLAVTIPEEKITKECG